MFLTYHAYLEVNKSEVRLQITPCKLVLIFCPKPAKSREDLSKASGCPFYLALLSTPWDREIFLSEDQGILPE